MCEYVTGVPVLVGLCVEGRRVGTTDGKPVGRSEGVFDGCNVGAKVGVHVGTSVGCVVGTAEISCKGGCGCGVALVTAQPVAHV